MVAAMKINVIDKWASILKINKQLMFELKIKKKHSVSYNFSKSKNIPDICQKCFELATICKNIYPFVSACFFLEFKKIIKFKIIIKFSRILSTAECVPTM